LSDKEVFEVTALAIAKGYCDGDLFIKKPHEIINLFTDIALSLEHEAQYIGWWNIDMGEEFWGGWTEDDITDTVLRYDYGDIYHFMLDYWDPHPGLTLGDLSGKRYMHIRKVI
jgi:hypothetical protein